MVLGPVCVSVCACVCVCVRAWCEFCVLSCVKTLQWRDVEVVAVERLRLANSVCVCVCVCVRVRVRACVHGRQCWCTPICFWWPRRTRSLSFHGRQRPCFGLLSSARCWRFATRAPTSITSLASAANSSVFSSLSSSSSRSRSYLLSLSPLSLCLILVASLFCYSLSETQRHKQR